jgi:hypothetical protein
MLISKKKVHSSISWGWSWIRFANHKVRSRGYNPVSILYRPQYHANEGVSSSQLLKYVERIVYASMDSLYRSCLYLFCYNVTFSKSINLAQMSSWRLL